MLVHGATVLMFVVSVVRLPAKTGDVRTMSSDQVEDDDNSFDLTTGRLDLGRHIIIGSWTIVWLPRWSVAEKEQASMPWTPMR